MGSTDSKLNFRKAVIQLTTKTQVHAPPCSLIRDLIIRTRCADERLGASPRSREERRGEEITGMTKTMMMMWSQKTNSLLLHD